jgi:uncharacterized protein YbbC (DUF1343 family)
VPATAFAAGIDVLLSKHRDWLCGRRRVGLLSHQAALDAAGATAAQRLRRELGGRLAALFGPEHGFLGQAGAGVATHTCRHPDWRIPVYSLYGARRRPTPEMLDGIDVVVCDLQDLGCRCYTYLATLRHLLEAAAAAGKAVIVCDRPVPLPNIVDGPMLDPAFASFVAPAALPLATGMTPAESARWLRRELRLDLDLRVAPMAGWRREGRRGAGWPEFVPPSPGIRTWESAATYLATVFSEALPGIDCGRGTNLAFRLLGAPWLRAEPFCRRMRAARLAGVRFHPHRYVAGVAPYEGRELDGVRIAVTDPDRFHPAAVSMHLLHALADQYGAARVWRHAGARPEWFDRLYGTGRVRRALLKGEDPGRIVAAWRPESRGYRQTREEALLYSRETLNVQRSTLNAQLSTLKSLPRGT